MFQEPRPEVITSAMFPLPVEDQAILRHILLGNRRAIEEAIYQLAARGYSHPTAWSTPMPVRANTPSFDEFLRAVEETGRSGGYISLMTRRRGVSS